MQNVEDIAHIIHDFFIDGIHLDDETVRFLTEVLGVDNREDTAALLNDKDGHGEGIIPLVFSPPSLLKRKIEPHVPVEGLDEGACNELVRVIAANTKKTVVYVPGFSGGIDVSIDEKKVSMITAGLHLQSDIHKVVPLKMTQRDADEFSLRARILLRSRAHHRGDEGDIYIRTLLGKMAEEIRESDEEKLAIIELVLRIFAEGDPDGDIFSLLRRRKQSMEKQLEMAGQFEEMRSRYSMDIIMSMKHAAPAVDPLQARKDIQRLDRASFLVLGRVPESRFDMQPVRFNPDDIWG